LDVSCEVHRAVQSLILSIIKPFPTKKTKLSLEHEVATPPFDNVERGSLEVCLANLRYVDRVAPWINFVLSSMEWLLLFGFR